MAKFPLAHFWPVKLVTIIILAGFAMKGRGDTITVTNTADSGVGSFRQAILTANANPGLDTIVFQISGTPPFTITPANALPAITDPVVIDATTQPGFAGKPVIELNGASTSGSTVGLRFVLGASTLRGIAINRFPVQLLELDSASNTIQGNFIGTDVTGTLTRGSGSSSEGILVKSPGNLIGGTNSGNGNVISGGNDNGIYLLNANNNIVQGNLIGVTAAGNSSLSNLNDGIVIYGCSGNLIGGPASSAGNTISGNGASGVYLIGAIGASTTTNIIQNNRIGTDISGGIAIGNQAGDGITLISAPSNTVCGNLISANGKAGVSITGIGGNGNVMLGNFIGVDITGTASLGNGYAGVTISAIGGNQIGGTNAGNGNLISGNVLDGIALLGGSAANLIQGNLIGISASGNSPLPNGQNGISISGGSSNLIGGTVAAARNIISGNIDNGIGILLNTDSGNTVMGNYIGTDVTGTQAIYNDLAGVRIQGCSNLIGGAVSGCGNVISGNGEQGVWLVQNSGTVTGNVIQGNIIGLDASGANSLGNDDAGIGITSAANNLVGGTTTGSRNIISANYGEGIFLIGDGTSNNIVQGNYLGTDVTGMNAHGNNAEGISVISAVGTLIGGTANGAGNLISANNNRGIYLGNASWNVIQANFVGTKIDGTNALPNFYHNIDIDAGSTNNIVGGWAAGAGNRLAFASIGASAVYCGARVRTGAYNNLIAGNSIFSNGALGIDLSPTSGGVSAGVNPIVDCESGIVAGAANAGQNFPTLSNALSGTSTQIRGTMDGKSGKSYTLQFFASPAGDPSGYGEGQVFLGQTNITLGSTCSSNFTANLPVSVSPGWVVTATATDTNRNTSEFSAWVPVIPAISAPTIQLTRSGLNQISISWTNNGGSFILQQTYNLSPPASWTTVSNALVPLNNLLTTTLFTTNGSVFYRLLVQ